MKNNNLLKVVCIAVMAMVLSACANNPVIPQIGRTEYIVVTPSADMLKKCHVTAPPDKTVFSTADKDSQLNMLFNLSSSLYSDLKLCNQRWTDMPEWFSAQQKVYSK